MLNWTGPLDPGKIAKAEEAKAICAGCPERLACLEGALLRKERDGVWGGVFETELRDLYAHDRRRLPMVVKPTAA